MIAGFGEIAQPRLLQRTRKLSFLAAEQQPRSAAAIQCAGRIEGFGYQVAWQTVTNDEAVRDFALWEKMGPGLADALSRNYLQVEEEHEFSPC